MNKIRLAITGAAGNIAYSLIFRIASGQVFGQNTAIELFLLEIEPAAKALKGVIMELEDCAFPLLKKIVGTTEAEEAFKDIDWALLIGSVPRKAGMERKELLSINAKVFVDQGKALSKAAKKTCKTLVVGNPCNTNSYILNKNCKDISEKNIFALTLLDQNRAIAQLANKAKVDSQDINNMIIWGNHSITQYPDFYNAKIKDKPVLDVIKDESWLQKFFIDKVSKRGAEIINTRGLSSAASAAEAIIGTIKNIDCPVENQDAFSLVVASDGSYGIEKGLMFSFPVVFNDKKEWNIVQNINHNSFSLKKIEETQEELIQERESIESFVNI